jgi:leucyl-tRNA synthetase
VYKHSDAVRHVKPAGPDARGDKLYRKTHLTIKKVTEDIEREFHFNTAIAALMEMVNEMYEYTSNGVTNDKLPIVRAAIEALTLLLAPFAPHFAEELWEALGGKGAIANAAWPQYDPGAIVATEITVVVQVNGKVRSKVTLPAGTPDKDIEAAALADAKVREYTAGKAPKKIIVVQGKLVNVVV